MPIIRHKSTIADQWLQRRPIIRLALKSAHSIPIAGQKHALLARKVIFLPTPCPRSRPNLFAQPVAKSQKHGLWVTDKAYKQALARSAKYGQARPNRATQYRTEPRAVCHVPHTAYHAPLTLCSLCSDGIAGGRRLCEQRPPLLCAKNENWAIKNRSHNQLLGNIKHVLNWILKNTLQLSS